jgi:hypothetical protein
MPDYQVIHEVSAALRDLLTSGFTADEEFEQHFGSDGAVDLQPPHDVVQSTQRLSLWLYQIEENEFVKNRSMQATADEKTQRFPPLVVNLRYLLTPLIGEVSADQRVLGRAMQILFDNARLMIPGRDDKNTSMEVSVVLARLSLEELTRVWDALREPYRLSVCYEVRLAEIQSRRVRQAGRIVERELATAVPA